MCYPVVVNEYLEKRVPLYLGHLSKAVPKESHETIPL